MALTDKLTAIGDAIRSKTGGTDGLTLDEMPEAIEGIETGGVSENDLILARLANTWPSGDLVINGEIEVPAAYALAGSAITALSCPDLSYIPGNNVFSYCPNLKTASFPSATRTLTSSTFVNCSALENFYAPNIETIVGTYIVSFTAVTRLEFPKLTGTIPGGAFRQNGQLRYVDLGVAQRLTANVFYQCPVFTHLALRKTDEIATLTDVKFFTNTPFAGYNGLVGYCYVPSALISEYQEATNWASLYEAGTCVFRALEDYTVDGTTTGAMDWDKIEAEEEEAEE